MATVTATASAQQWMAGPSAIDTLYFRTENSADAPAKLRFGFSPDYTDTIDFKGPEFEIPGAPPSFYGAFIYQPPDNGNNRPYINADIRGVPDSVLNGGVRRFEIHYVAEAFRNSAEGRLLVAEFARPLAPFIDSVRIVDAITQGLVVDHTFTHPGGAYTIDNDAITRLTVIAYFNLDVAGVIADDNTGSDHAELQLGPNPLRAGERLRIGQTIPAGARVIVSDVRGAIVETANVVEETKGLAIDLPGVASGIYMVRVLTANGTSLNTGRVVVIN